MDFLRPAYGSVLVDMSCGSGLFSRRFLASDKFAGVIAADFSESMLQEAKRFLDQDKTLDDRSVLITQLFMFEAFYKALFASM
jgi:ubiquinone/menaquinone biosynthesis C-methylase UbiE